MQLKATNIHCGYNQKMVLRGVDLSVNTGEILCILGPNGSGKSTLFKAILGLIRIREGKVVFNNQSLLKMSRLQMAKIIGYVPQTHDPPFPFKVKDVLLIGRTAYIGTFSSPNDEDYEVVEEVAASLKIEHLYEKSYTQLSGGERQLVLIARALAQRPKVLVMDEPTASLDYGNQLMVLEHVQKLTAFGLAVIMISHMPEHALHYSNRVVLLKGGRIYGDGTPEEIVTEDNMKLLYGIDTKIAAVTLNSGRLIKVCVPEQIKINGGKINEKNF